jgi:hypothetical protein
MPKNLKNNKLKGLFFVWKKYQRRPEVLAPLLDAKTKFIPHLFKSKYLRPLDYAFKLLVSIREILVKKPDIIIAQCPPIFSALPALLTGTPYILDAHNPFFQVKMWQKLPLTGYLINNALAIIIHNSEILKIAKDIYPSARFFNIPDPIETITSDTEQKRIDKQILVISSFDPWDEPIDLLVEVMDKMPEYTFIVTADVNKLSSETSQHLQRLDNVVLTGFLPTKEYHAKLCSSMGALVLTNSEATQPSGACEALSSDTQLILSKTSLTQKLFGDWAVLVENSSESIAKAIASLSPKSLNLSRDREQWNRAVKQEIRQLYDYIE